MTGPPAPFAIRPFRDGDAAALLGAEHRASALLDAQGLHDPTPPSDLGSFRDFLARHTVLVAEAEGRPVGYGAGRDLGPLYWLRELAVDPVYGRRGIGARLVKAMADEARASFHRAIGLTTYRAVPFNAPFYARCGFVTVSRQQMDATFRERLGAEWPAGAPAESRTAMIKWL